MSIKKEDIPKLLTVSASPHIQNDDSVNSIMWTVFIFLLPAAVFGIIAFGWFSLLVILVSIVSSISFEALTQRLRERESTVYDGSAALTGLLIGMNMPPNVPLYIPVIASFFAIAIVKQAFGGLGYNWVNPAIAARVFAFVAWPTHMTNWVTPFVYDISDGVTTATPLGALKSALMNDPGAANGPYELLSTVSKNVLRTDTEIWRLFFGLKGGCIGEISIFLLLVAAIYLIYRKIITLDIPVSYIGTVVLMAWIFDGLRFGNGFFSGDPVFHLLTGGLVLGAFFMATDMVTTPITTKGRVIFGIGCGLMTMLIRMYGSYPEGVSLSILFMNMFTPAIDRYIKIKPLGYISVK